MKLIECKKIKRTKDFQSQMRQVIKAFHCVEGKTMLQVAIETGILRANICRFVAELEKNGKIRIVKRSECPHTHCIAGFYSTRLFQSLL